MSGSKSMLLRSLMCITLGVLFAALNPEEYVNILGGTDSSYHLSHGGTLPLIARPWGFNSWAPITSPSDGGWWFHPSDRSFYGMRLTHQPSPWISDYGTFIVKASVTSPYQSGDNDQYSGYSPLNSHFSPYYFKTTLTAYGTATEDMSFEFTPSVHGGIFKFKFPSYVSGEANSGFEQSRRVAIILNGGSDSSALSLPSDGRFETATIVGISTQNSGGVASSLAHYFVASIYSGINGNEIISECTSHKNTSSEVSIDFSPLDPKYDLLTVRIATSFISLEQAILNLKEVDKLFLFEDIVAEGKKEWNSVLSRALVVNVGAGYTEAETNDFYTTFYSCLYRASLFPRQLTEIDASGAVQHWSPFHSDGGVFAGPLTTDSGFWDAYNSVYPYLSIINRPVLGTMIQGWINGYKEGGWLPKWASPGYRNSMAGSMGDVSLADAIIKRIPGFDVHDAYQAIRKDAFELPPKGVVGVGRVCLESYEKNGFIAHGSSQTTGGTCPEVVSQTLNYMQADFAISKAASFLGFEEDASFLMKRALNYSNIFDNATSFFRSRDVYSHKFVEPFDQFAWGGDYTEGGPWQFKFYVPHDPKGLSDLYQKNGQNLCDHLESAQNQKSIFHIGDYGTEIHEETEMPDGCWGQYAHNNQPVHHMLYMFIASDPNGWSGSCSSKGQYWLRKATSTLYKPTADMFMGDEDNGEMGAWFILSSLGLYGLSPGDEEYVLGSPLFARVEVNLDDGPFDSSGDKKNVLIIEALNQSRENVFVQSILWNGEPLISGAASIRHSTLIQGGTLSFSMGPSPVKL